MTKEKAIEIIQTEKKCVARANICDRDCANCYLVLPEEEILAAYDMAIDSILIVDSLMKEHIVDSCRVTSLDDEDDRK